MTLDETTGEQARSPQFVAGGRSVLFTLRSSGAEAETPNPLRRSNRCADVVLLLKCVRCAAVS